MIPFVSLPWRQYFTLPQNVWRVVWFHVGGIRSTGTFECVRGHCWFGVLYTWSHPVKAFFGTYYEVRDNRRVFSCPFCNENTADRFIPADVPFVDWTLPPRQLGPTSLLDVIGDLQRMVDWPRRLFPWE